MFADNILLAIKDLRFPENAGMAARACANMGFRKLCLISPRNWDPLKAWPTATSCGQPVLKNLRIYPDYENAFSGCHAVYGTSARTGGRRKNARSPASICREITERLACQEKIALLFGPEDRGLSNADLSFCAGIITIDTDRNSSSLNIAQAMLLVLYELRSALKEKSFSSLKASGITLAELLRLEKTLKESLEKLQCLHGENSAYAFQHWHELLCRANLRQHEYDALMGFCRQLNNILK